MFGSEEKTNNVNLEIKGSGNQTVILVTIKRKPDRQGQMEEKTQKWSNTEIHKLI